MATPQLLCSPGALRGCVALTAGGYPEGEAPNVRGRSPGTTPRPPEVPQIRPSPACVSPAATLTLFGPAGKTPPCPASVLPPRVGASQPVPTTLVVTLSDTLGDKTWIVTSRALI